MNVWHCYLLEIKRIENEELGFKKNDDCLSRIGLTFEEVVFGISRVGSGAASMSALNEIIALDQIVMTRYLMALQLVARLWLRSTRSTSQSFFVIQIAKFKTVVFSWLALLVANAVFTFRVQADRVLISDLVSFDVLNE